MTPDEIRASIAEARGYLWHKWGDLPNARPYLCSPHELVASTLFIPCARPASIDVACLVAVPDYCNDLNACHEMEKILEPNQQIGSTGYMHFLWEVCARSRNDGGNTWAIAHATALQRCEAFLRTLGKWKDAP